MGLCLFCSCSQKPHVVHPTSENLVPEDRLSFHVSSESRSPNDSRLAAFARRLRDVRRVGVILTEGFTGAPFQRVQDVVVDSANRVAVLDSRLNEIRVFTPEGTLGAVFGPDELGAAALEDPSAVMAASGYFLVADRDHKIKELPIDSKGAPSGSVAFSLSARPEDLCLLSDDRVFARFVNDSQHVIHQYDLSGVHQNSFGERYISPSVRVSARLSRGRIACVPGAEMVLALFEYFPFIYGYSSSGDLQWVSKLDSFLMQEITERPVSGDSVIRYHRPESFDAFVSFVSIAERITALQVGRWSTGRREPDSIRTYLIDAVTGQGEYIGDSLPVIRASAGNRLYCTGSGVGVGRDPHTRLLVYELP